MNAFDEPNKQSCFLKVWTALETLLRLTIKMILSIKRCLTIYDDKSKPMQRQTLEALKNYRNDFVHEGIEASKENLSTFCYKIQANILYILKFNAFTNFIPYSKISRMQITYFRPREGLI